MRADATFFDDTDSRDKFAPSAARSHFEQLEPLYFTRWAFRQCVDELNHFGGFVFAELLLRERVELVERAALADTEGAGRALDQRSSTAFNAAPTSDGVSSTVTPAASSVERLEA